MISHGPRTDRVLRELETAELDCLLVTELINLRYLTGYTGSNGLALIGPTRRVFVTDFRYVEQAAGEVDRSYQRVQAPGELILSVPECLAGTGPVRLGFDDAHLTARDHARLRKILPSGVELVEAGDLVERLRLVKEPGEVERIAAAAALADEALEDMLKGGLVGRTERELALVLEMGMRERGAQAAAFAPIIAAGPHGALPHAEPRSVAVQAGQLVVLDWGAVLDGYCSDCTRTVSAGEPDGESAEVYALVLEAQLAGLRALRANVAAADLDRQVRDVIAAAGYGEYFGHGLGHGIGLAMHEGPRLSAPSQDVLEVGNVVTVEPGVYLPGRFGVRIEDLVVVGDEGGRILTGIDKSLTVVD